MGEQERVIRFSECPVSRWKNGAGETREIARHPAVGVFDWRVSMATVSEASEFSEFPGIDRRLGVAVGRLAVTIGGTERRLDVGDDPLRFSGTDAVAARPLDGTVTDVNLMLRHGAADGELTALRGGVHRLEAGELVVIALAEGLLLRQPGPGATEIELGRLDAWRVSVEEPLAIELGSPGGDGVIAYAAYIRAVRPRE